MVDRLTLRGILFWIWFAVELNSLTERTRRNETTTSNTSIWLWIFLPSSSVLYAAQQTFGSASVAVGSAASDSEQQQHHLSSSGSSASQGRTTNTIVWRRRRCRWQRRQQRRQQLAVRCEQVEAEAEDVDASAAAATAADATLRSAATPTRCLFALAHFRWQRRRSLSHREQQRKREGYREGERENSCERARTRSACFGFQCGRASSAEQSDEKQSSAATAQRAECLFLGF